MRAYVFLAFLAAVVLAAEDLKWKHMAEVFAAVCLAICVTRAFWLWQDLRDRWCAVSRFDGQGLDCHVIDDNMFLSELRSSLDAVLQRRSSAQLAAFVQKRIQWAQQAFEETIDLTFLDMSELEGSQDIINKNDLSTINVQRVQWCGTMFALKFYEKSERERFQHEASIHVRLHHPNVVSVIALFEAVDQHKHGILMELMEEDLAAYLKRHVSTLGWLEKVRILLQIANGMEYLHKRGVIHRDVKPQNVLVRQRPMDITEGSGILAQQLEVKVSDFGESKASLVQHTKRVGTSVYRAPEVLSVDDENNYDRSIDVYSYAMTAYQVLFEKEPFDGHGGNWQALYSKVIKGTRPNFASGNDAACPPYLKHCLKNWWSGDPKTRHSFTHICCILMHLCACLERCPRNMDPMRQYPFLAWSFGKWNRVQNLVKEELFKCDERENLVSVRIYNDICKVNVMEWALRKTYVLTQMKQAPKIYLMGLVRSGGSVAPPPPQYLPSLLARKSWLSLIEEGQFIVGQTKIFLLRTQRLVTKRLRMSDALTMLKQVSKICLM